MDAKPTGKLIGYARVSTKDQNLRMQVDDLKKAGCWNIWEEKRSSSRGKRPELEKALTDLRPGDTLVVWKIDRLARSVRELYDLLDRINAAGAAFKSLREQYDFTTSIGRYVLGSLALAAQLERDLIADRTGAGIRALQAAGGSYGAKRKLSRERHIELKKLRKAGWSFPRLGKQFKLSPAGARNYSLRPVPKRTLKR